MDEQIVEVLDKLTVALMDAKSARRRITGESRHDPLPPLDGTIRVIEQARTMLQDLRGTAGA